MEEETINHSAGSLRIIEVVNSDHGWMNDGSLDVEFSYQDIPIIIQRLEKIWRHQISIRNGQKQGQ